MLATPRQREIDTQENPIEPLNPQLRPIKLETADSRLYRSVIVTTQASVLSFQENRGEGNANRERKRELLKKIF